MKDKKEFEAAQIQIVVLESNMLISSGGTLAEDKWDSFDFGSL